MDIILKTQNISGGYNGEDIIKNLTFEIRKGEFTCIAGPNGAGKSTLLRMMSRTINTREGSIHFEDRDLSSIKRKEISRYMAFVSQNTMINFSFSVFEIVLMGRIPYLKRLQRESENDIEAVEKALRLTDTIDIKNKMIDCLSAGESQRVIIARALAQEPDILFLDEPTSHLDIGYQAQIMDLLRKLNKCSGLTVVAVLHDLNLACEYCGRLILLNKGRIFKDGKPKEIVTRENIKEIYGADIKINYNADTGNPNILIMPGTE